MIWDKEIQIKVIKIARSHSTDAMVNAGIISARDREGNNQADHFAELGAGLASPKPEEVSDTEKVYTMARYVQIRLADCAAITLDDPSIKDRPYPAKPEHTRA